MKNLVSFILFIAISAYTYSQQPQKRIALVIGVKNYQNVPALRYSINDANDIAATLKTKGFEVELLLDPKSKSELKEGITRYYNLMKEQSQATGVLYFAGHGISYQGDTYFVPASANLQGPSDLQEQCVKLNTVADAISASNTNLNILFFDASRNLPNFSRGFSSLEMIGAPQGMIVVFSSQPGMVASDGAGRNSLFASKLLQYLNEPNLKLAELLNKVKQAVSTESGNSQICQIEDNSFGEDFYFSPAIITTKNETQSDLKSSSQVVSNEKQRGEELRFENENIIKPIGDYYALLIGVSKYDNPTLDLNKPIKDATQFKNLLSQKYSFKDANITFLENPNRHQILKTLFDLRKLTSDDNLVVFYAGHGFYDEKIKQGYWLPKDAEPDDPSNWLSNSDIKEQLKGINTAHTLLIVDACFGGSILRDASMIKGADMSIQMLYKLPSRQVLTSTTLKPVPDDSQFLYYLLKRLDQNEKEFLSAGELFNSFKIAVISNSKSVPQYEPIPDLGHEGGDFIFIKKKTSTK